MSKKIISSSVLEKYFKENEIGVKPKFFSGITLKVQYACIILWIVVHNNKHSKFFEPLVYLRPPKNNVRKTRKFILSNLRDCEGVLNKYENKTRCIDNMVNELLLGIFETKSISEFLISLNEEDIKLKIVDNIKSMHIFHQSCKVINEIFQNLTVEEMRRYANDDNYKMMDECKEKINRNLQKLEEIIQKCVQLQDFMDVIYS
jgi:hypothetical protein